MRRVALALALVLVAAGVVALAESGCSTTQATGVRAERPVDTTPDGGWQAYTPAGPQYGPNPAEAAMGQPTISPFGLAGTDVH